MKNLIPQITNPTPDYYCTWQTQLYHCNNGGPEGQRLDITEENLFGNGIAQGWAYMYPELRKDLFIVIDDGWDVELSNDEKYFGCLQLSREKYPEAWKGAKNNTEALKNLSDRIKALGWKGLGIWVCCQESDEAPAYTDYVDYWRQRLEESRDAGIAYWKVDWGKRCEDPEFRKMLTNMGHEIAPDLILDQAKTEEVIPYSDVFRTYDVAAIISLPATLDKLVPCFKYTTAKGYGGIVNCEDEAYIGAVLGSSLGIMRHNMVGNLPNGEPDLSFPALHRNLKTKMAEVKRGVNWHKISPAFGVNEADTHISEETFTDSWNVYNWPEEFEEWWGHRNGDTVTRTAPAMITRGVDFPKVTPDRNGMRPFVIASISPNEKASVATLGRTLDRYYITPKCDIELDIKNCKTVGAFGTYGKLTLNADYDFSGAKVYMQDLAGEEAVDITEKVEISGNKLSVCGCIIDKIGTSAQSDTDTSEPGVVISIEF